MIERLRRRVASLCDFLIAHETQVVDGLVDLLIDAVHEIGMKAERKAAKALARNVERINGKDRLLAGIAQVAVDEPTVRFVL